MDEALSRKQLVMWSLILGGIAVMWVVWSAIAPMSNESAAVDVDTCYAYIERGGKASADSRIPLFPDATTVQAAKTAIDAADDSKFQNIARTGVSLIGVTKLKIEASGPGYYRAKVASGPHIGTTGFIFAVDCHGRPPQ